jgi:glyceraldehyde-3-phosphate dehydrogenase (NADP+)
MPGRGHDGPPAPRCCSLASDGAATASAGVLEVRNPENGDIIGSVARATTADAERAIMAAVAARSLARSLPVHRRQSVLMAVAAAVENDREVFARTIALEGVKTIREARGEVARAAMTLRLAAEEAARLSGETIAFGQRPGSERRFGYTVREPAGIVVAITPFNDPLNLVAHKVGPAIAAGNPVILKPHEQTPFSALRLADEFRCAGLPPGILQVLTGRGQDIGDTLIASPQVRMISFTGGRGTGERIAARAGLKKLIMELGSNCPTIVMADADIGSALEQCVSGAFAAAGQNCLHVQRIYVQRGIYGSFRDEFASRARVCRTGRKLDETTDMGCLVSEESAQRIDAVVRSAVASGGRILTGGTRDGTCMQPAVLENVPDTHPLLREEIFGPVTVLCVFDDFDEAIARANDVDYRVDSMPFGGIKGSGLGREGVRSAVLDMTEPKVVCFNRTAGV